jgi:hypothetical protein
MLTIWKQSIVFFALLTYCCATHAVASEPKDYRKFVELGFAHWQCAAYGMLTVSDKHKKIARRSFLRGTFLVAEWLQDMKSGKATKESIEFAPKSIELMPFPGPPLDFRLGYIWAQVEMNARQKTYPKSTGIFLRFGRFGDSNKDQQAEAEKQFRTDKCESLN